MNTELNLTIREESVRIVTLAPHSRLDAFSAPKFREQLQTLYSQGINHIVVDLSQTPFLDSAGMAVLVSALKHCREANGDVRLVWPQAESAKRILALTKFDRVFQMKSSVNEAVESFHT